MGNQEKQKEEKVREIMIIAHGCPDGHSSIALLKSSFESQTCKVNYKTANPDTWMDLLSEFIVNEKNEGEKPFIFVADFNMANPNDIKAQELLEKIKARGNVIIIDHHKEAVWLNKEEGIDAQVVVADSAAGLVHNILKANTLNEGERKEKNLDNCLIFPEKLRNSLNTDYEKLNKFNSFVEAIDKIDSGKDGHDDIIYVFKSSKAEKGSSTKHEFIDEIVNNYTIRCSDEQRKEVEEHIRKTAEKKRDFMKKALEGKVRILRVVKDNNGLLCAEIICPKNILAYDVSKAFKESIKMKSIDYLRIFRAHDKKVDGKVKVSLVSVREDVDVAKIAVREKGSGHKNSAGCLADPEVAGIIKNGKEYEFVGKALQPFANCGKNDMRELKKRIRNIVNKMRSEDFAFA